jgi:hypothetical protein
MSVCCSSFHLLLYLHARMLCFLPAISSLVHTLFPKNPHDFPLCPTSNRPPTLTCGSSQATYPLCASSISLLITWNFSLSFDACVCTYTVFSLSVSTVWTTISSLISSMHSTWVCAIYALASSSCASISATHSCNGSI